MTTESKENVVRILPLQKQDQWEIIFKLLSIIQSDSADNAECYSGTIQDVFKMHMVWESDKLQANIKSLWFLITTCKTDSK
jgi:hypothetical protein